MKFNLRMAFLIFVSACLLRVTTQAQRTATGVASVVNGFVISVSVTDPGSGYTSPPLVAFSGGGGEGARASATIANGAVSFITVTDAGSGYTSPPTVILTPVSTSDFTTGLIAYYPFNGDANDASPNGNNGIVQNAALTTDRFGATNKAYRFNGINSVITATNRNYLSFPNGEFTISLWAELDSQPSPTTFLVGLDNGSGETVKWIFFYGQPQVPVGSPGNYVGFHINDPVVDNSWLGLNPASPLLGTWHQYAVTKSGTKYTTYFDGVAASVELDYAVNNLTFRETSGTNGPAAIPAGITAPLTIGESEGHGFVNGKLDEIRIYNRALSNSEVQALFQFEHRPFLSIEVKTVQVDMYLVVGFTYQLQSSFDLSNWIPVGIPFIATSAVISQELDVLQTGRYFRVLQVSP